MCKKWPDEKCSLFWEFRWGVLFRDLHQKIIHNTSTEFFPFSVIFLPGSNRCQTCKHCHIHFNSIQKEVTRTGRSCTQTSEMISGSKMLGSRGSAARTPLPKIVSYSSKESFHLHSFSIQQRFSSHIREKVVFGLLAVILFGSLQNMFLENSPNFFSFYCWQRLNHHVSN